MNCITYRSGYNYQLQEDYVIATGIEPVPPTSTEYISLAPYGTLTIRKGYAWDGPSGPAIDTLNFMRGSLVHDALYQLMREGLLEGSFRESVDRLLQRICKEDGMSTVRAWWVYQGVRFGGGAAADPARKKPFILAPRSCQSA